MKKRSRKVLGSERGFTLIELGVVMDIIAILAAVTYPTYKNIRERAYVAEAKAAMQEIRVEAWAYFVQKEDFPAYLPGETVGTAAIDSGHLTITAEKVTGAGGGADTYVITAKKTGGTTDFLTLTLKTTGEIEWGGSAAATGGL